MNRLPTLIAAALPFVITPGASFTLTLTHAARSRAPSWRGIALGTGTGLALLALVLGATGLGGWFTAAPVARVALGLAGGAVLVLIGTTVLIRAVRPATGVSEKDTAPKLVRWSFAAVVSNPKALGLYVIIVPALATPALNGPALYAAFAAVHISMLTGWLCLTHHTVRRIPALSTSPRLRRALSASAGTTMIALGVLTAAQALTDR